MTENDWIISYIDTFDYDGEYLTWTTDGIYAGTVFYRNGKFSMTTHCGALKLKTAYAGQASLRCVAQQATAEFMKNSVGDGNKGVTICNRSFKFTHFRPLKSIQKKPLNIYHPLHFHAGDGKCAYSGGLAHV